MKKKETNCITIWRDEEGRFTREPKEKSPRGNRGRVIRGDTLTIKGGSKRGVVRKVKFVSPELIQVRKTAQTPDDKRAAKRYAKQLTREAYQEYQLSEEAQREGMSKSQSKSKAQRALAARRKRQAAQARLKRLTNAQLIVLKPKDVYEKRAQRAELKRRGL